MSGAAAPFQPNNTFRYPTLNAPTTQSIIPQPELATTDMGFNEQQQPLEASEQVGNSVFGVNDDIMSTLNNKIGTQQANTPYLNNSELKSPNPQIQSMPAAPNHLPIQTPPQFSSSGMSNHMPHMPVLPNQTPNRPFMDWRMMTNQAPGQMPTQMPPQFSPIGSNNFSNYINPARSMYNNRTL